MLNIVILCSARAGYYFHSVNVISLSLSQNDHITLYKFFLHKNKEWMMSVGAHDFCSTNPKLQLNQLNKQSLWALAFPQGALVEKKGEGRFAICGIFNILCFVYFIKHWKVVFTCSYNKAVFKRGSDDIGSPRILWYLKY